MNPETVNRSAPGRRRASADVLPLIWRLVQAHGMKVGDQLPSIRELAEQLEVKPTTVRDALLRAQTMGLVRILPRAGAFLQATSLVPKTTQGAEDLPLEVFRSVLMDEEHNLFHLLDARRLIEIELAGRAAGRRHLEDLLPVRSALEAMLKLPEEASCTEYTNHDVRFHVEIARLAGTPVLFAVHRALMELIRPHLNEAPKTHQRRVIADRSHLAIYKALVAGDADKARTTMRDHLSLAYDSLLRQVQEPPDAEQTLSLRVSGPESPGVNA